MHVEREYNRIPCWVAREYLLKLGGIETGEGDMRGEGWSATYRPGPPTKVGPWPVETIRVTFEGEPEALNPIIKGFELKMLRGGG